jgi:hypothetical protein
MRMRTIWFRFLQKKYIKKFHACVPLSAPTLSALCHSRDAITLEYFFDFWLRQPAWNSITELKSIKKMKGIYNLVDEKISTSAEGYQFNNKKLRTTSFLADYTNFLNTFSI